MHKDLLGNKGFNDLIVQLKVQGRHVPTKFITGIYPSSVCCCCCCCCFWGCGVGLISCTVFFKMIRCTGRWKRGGGLCIIMLYGYGIQIYRTTGLQIQQNLRIQDGYFTVTEITQL